MKFKMQMGIKGVVQIHRQFACQSDYLAFTRLHAETSKPCTAESQGGCIRGGIAGGYSAFSHLPLKFLLLGTVGQSMVDEMTQDCYSSVVEGLLFLCHEVSPTLSFLPFAQTCRIGIPVRACLCEASP